MNKAIFRLRKTKTEQHGKERVQKISPQQTKLEIDKHFDFRLCEEMEGSRGHVKICFHSMNKNVFVYDNVTVGKAKLQVIKELELPETTKLVLSIHGTNLTNDNMTIANACIGLSSEVTLDCREEEKKEKEKLSSKVQEKHSNNSAYELVNENDVDEELKCHICREPCLNPVILSECGNMFAEIVV